MLAPSSVVPGSTAKGGALNEIAASVRRLEVPSPALYRQAGHERRTKIDAVVHGTEVALHQVTRDQLAGVARLESLDENPEPQTGNNFNYIDQIVGGKTNTVRAPLGGKRLTPQEIAEVEAKAAPHAVAHLSRLALYMGVQGVLLALAMLTDFFLLFQAFDYLTGGQLVPTVVLSCASTLVLSAFHVEALHAPDTKAIRFIHNIAPWAIAGYALAAGLAIAATLYLNGGDSMLTGELSADVFALPEEGGPSFIERAVSNLGGLGFAIACGGMIVVNLVLAHRLAVRFDGNLREFTDKRAKAEATKADIRLIRECDETATALLAGCGTELARLGAPDTFADAVTTDILAAIARELQPYQTWLIDRAARRTQTPQSRFASVHDDLKPEEIRRRVDALRSISFDDIYPCVCGQSHKPAKPVFTTGAHHETVH